MNTPKIIFAPAVDTAITQLIDHVDHDDIPAVIAFLERLQTRLIKTLRTFPESGTRFQGHRRMMVVEKYTFVYEYHAKLNEVHVLEMNAPGQNWR